jgi:hypothetical protein
MISLVCGCCDDVNFGQEDQHSKHQRNDDCDVADRDAAVDTLDSDSIGINGSSSGRICYGVSCHNIGFKRYGKFSDLDILAVHPAGKDDPTATGLQGTECLRESRDIYSTDLTFSLIIRDSTTTQGFTTLDIECDSVDCYYLLLRGFYLLEEESVIHRNRLKENLTNKSSSFTEHYDIERGEMMLTSGYEGRGGYYFPGSSLDYQHFERLFTLWNSTKGYVTTAAQSLLHPRKAQEDPVDLLYQPASTMDPFRALMVGGGLLSTTSRQSISLKKSLKSPPPSHNSNVNVCGEDEGFISPSVKDFTSPDSIVFPIHPINNENKNNNSSSMNMRLPVAQFLGWNSAGTQIWARLKMAGLDVKCILSWDLQRVILKIRCPNWRLEQMAEQMHLKVKSRTGYLKQFKVSRRDTFLHIDANGTVFRSSERQQIIDYIIRSKIKDGGAELDESTELGRHIVQRFPLHMYSKLTDIQHSWVTFWKRENVGIIPEPWSPFTESYVITYKNITESVEFFCLNILNQPLDSIAEYFGENIAFYFAYMSFYTRWLVFPSILGLIVFCIQMQSGQMDHWLCPIFAIIVMIWACFMLAFWRQKASTLAFRWGVLDYEIEETQRPQFRGEYTYDESSGDVRKTYSVWKRVFKYCITMPVLLICITTTLIIMTSVFYSQDVMTNQYFDGEPISYAPTFPSIQSNTLLLSTIINNSSTTFILPSLSDITTLTPISKQDSVIIQSQHTLSRLLIPTPSDNYHNSTWSRSISINDMADGEFWAVTFFYPCVYGIVVSVLTCIFQFIAIWLNDFENHRTQTSYMNRLVLKIFSFQFVTIFTSLYYYAFFMNDHEGAYVRIAVTIFSLMTVGQWWSILMDIYVPAAYHKFLLYMMKTGFSKTNRKIYSAKAHVEALRRQEMKRNRKKRKQQSIVIDGNQVGDNNANTKANNSNHNENHHQIESVILNEKLEKRIAYFEQAKSQCWQEALQPEYCNFGDYTNMVIQIGFVLFFSSVFPLCPLLALINNLALIRFNAMKLCCTRKRPIAQKIGGLGVWEDVIQIMSVGGILTNCAFFGLTATGARHVLLPSISGAGLAALLFAYEHTILFFKYWLHSSVPAIAPSVQRARSRELKSIDRRASQLNQQHHQQQQQSLANINQSGHKSDHQSNAAVDRNHQRAEGSLSEYWFDLSANPDHYDTAEVILNGLTNEDDNEAENKAYDDDTDTAIMLLDKNNSTVDINIITQSCFDSINYEGGHEDEAADETQSLLPPSLAPNDIISPKIVVDNNRSPMSITIHPQSYNNNNARNKSNSSKKNNSISTPSDGNTQHLLPINDDKSNRKMKVRFADDCNSDVSPYHNHQLPRRKSLSPIGKNYNPQKSTYFDDDDYDFDDDDDLSELSEEEDLWEEEEEVSSSTPSLLPNEYKQHDRRRTSNVSNHSKIHGGRRVEDDDQRKRSMEQSDRVAVKPINGNDNNRRESIVTPFLQWLWPTAIAAAGTASDIHNINYNNDNKSINIQGDGYNNSVSKAVIDGRLKSSDHSHSITPVKSTPRRILSTIAAASASKGMGIMSATPATVAASPAINPSRLPSISRPSFSGARGGKKLNIVPLGRLTAAKKDLKSTSTIELANKSINNPNNNLTSSNKQQQHRSPMEFQSPFSFVHSLDDVTTTPLSFDPHDHDHVQNLNIADDIIIDNHQPQNNENNKYAANSRIVRVSPLQKQRISPQSKSPKSVMKPFIIQTVVSPPRNQVPYSTSTHAFTVAAGAPTLVNTPMPKATSPMMNKGNMERTRVSTSPLHATSAAKRIVNNSNSNNSSTPVTSPIQSHSNNVASSKKAVTTPSNNNSKQQHQLSTAATGTSNPYQILLHQLDVGTNADRGGGLRISISVSPPRNNQSPRN